MNDAAQGLVIDLDGMVTAAVLTGVRVSGLFVFAPLFGSVAIPMRVKAVLVALCTAVIYPTVSARIHAVVTPETAVPLIAGELAVGVLAGFTVQLVFEAVQFAGHVLGLQMGYSLVNMLDPQTQVDTPVLSLLYQTVAMLVFLQMNVHHWLLRGIARSFSYLPPGEFRTSGAVGEQLVALIAGVWLIGFQIAAPVVMATVMADLILGFLGKAAPQLPVLFLGIPVKAMLGFVVMLGTLKYVPSLMERHFSAAIAAGERLLRLAR
ncbi:MAG TPA: flagellar biosynthetic protein FliR [Clostridia bacterium]|nr:flagellar biosynthetic protein FliR [Clostridia bacterium]